MISFRNRMTAAAALALLASAAGAAGPPGGALTRCPVDAVVSGAGCMDKYEASVWRVPNSRGANMALVRRIQQGKATAALLAAGGATQLGIAPIDDYAPCADSGQNCWVADWVPRATACGTWSASLSPTGDDQCIAGAAGTGEPGALLRGGSFFSGSLAGPLAVLASNPPSGSNNGIGFRCTR